MWKGHNRGRKSCTSVPARQSSLMPYVMKEYYNGGKTVQEQYFRLKLWQTRMVIECSFSWLKARFGALWAMDINLDDFPYVIYACFILNNFWEHNNETIREDKVSTAN